MKSASVVTCAALALLAVKGPQPDPPIRGSAPHPVVAAPLSRRPGEPGDRDWPQFGWDAARSSASPAPTGITAGNVGSLRRQQVAIDGTVDASAIYLSGVRVRGETHDVLIVTTTYGKTLALDANQGSVLWEYTPAGFDSWAGSARITNATPIADPDRTSIYAASPDGHVQKLALADGRAMWSTAITLLPDREKIASPLSLLHGHVVAVTGGYIGDAAPYQGHVAILDAASGRLLHVWNSLCSDRSGLIQPASCDQSGSAIWGRAGAVIDSTSGNIFVATGNGRWDGRTDWGDATLVLDHDATRLVANETPTNTDQLDDADLDVGSTSPVWLGGGYVAQGGKDGKIRLLELSPLSGGTPHRGVEAQVVSTPSGAGLFSAPAVLHAAATTWMFAADRAGTAAWTFSAGRLQLVWSNRNGGTSPVVAGGLLYVYDPGGSLRIYEPQSGQAVAMLPCGSGHWNSPIIIDGKIVLPEGNANRHDTHGIVDIWRLP
jgi:outer membrane protein assembly factor BamB